MSDDFLSPTFEEIGSPKTGPRLVLPYEILLPGNQKEQADFRPHISKVRQEVDEDDFTPKDSSVPGFAPSSAPPLPPNTDDSQVNSAVAVKVSTGPQAAQEDLPF